MQTYYLIVASMAVTTHAVQGPWTILIVDIILALVTLYEPYFIVVRLAPSFGLYIVRYIIIPALHLIYLDWAIRGRTFSPCTVDLVRGFSAKANSVDDSAGAA
jgi:hypothetical protein